MCSGVVLREKRSLINKYFQWWIASRIICNFMKMDGDNENVSSKTIAVSTSLKETKEKSHISIEQFLNFLKTAYQVKLFHY